MMKQLKKMLLIRLNNAIRRVALLQMDTCLVHFRYHRQDKYETNLRRNYQWLNKKVSQLSHRAMKHLYHTWQHSFFHY